jgi:hypothetical protein
MDAAFANASAQSASAASMEMIAEAPSAITIEENPSPGMIAAAAEAPEA